MKVLQINAVYGQGSTGTIVRDIERLCGDNGIECFVASPDLKVKEAKNGYIIGNTLDHKTHALLSRIHGKQAYFSHYATRQLLHHIEKINPDIVHLHNLHSNFINLNMLLDYLAKKDIKTIITLHDCWFFTGGCFHYTADGCKGWLDKCGVCPKGKEDPVSIFSKRTAKILSDRKKYLLAIPHLVVAGVSDWIASEARRTFFKDSKVLTIHNGIDMTVFKPTQSDFRKRLDLESKYVILGPASKWLLPVNKDVLTKFTNLMQADEALLLFGVYQETKNMPSNVKTYGYTRNRTKLAKLYTMADVFVNTTHEDSHPLINLEPQACGTPVVTFNQTGTKETVDDINSFNVSVGNAIELYNAVQRVRKHSSLNISDKCRQFVADKFEVNNNYMKLIQLYKSIEK